MATATKFEAFSEHLAEKVHDLNADTLKAYLSNTTPSPSLDAVKADLDRFDALVGGSPDLQRLVRSPVFTAEEQTKALAAVLDSPAKMSTGTRSYSIPWWESRRRTLKLLPEGP